MNNQSQQGQQLGVHDMKIHAYKKNLDEELVKKQNEIYEMISGVSYKECEKEVTKAHLEKMNKDKKNNEKIKSKDLNKDAITIDTNNLFASKVVKYLNDNGLSIKQYEDRETEEVVVTTSKKVKEYRFKINMTSKVES
jgi:hypothetical protein